MEQQVNGFHFSSRWKDSCCGLNPGVRGSRNHPARVQALPKTTSDQWRFRRGGCIDFAELRRSLRSRFLDSWDHSW